MFAALVLAATVAPGIELRLPIACTPGADCLIQQYPDHDPGTGAADYTCAHQSYDGHDGTDFRLPDKIAQAKGVAVIAAAGGTVVGLRDGEPDFAVGAFNATLVKDKECGNGVVIRHDGGWETQYCHMRQGSVAVKKGQAVKAGDTLGLVGQSGDAAFVHLHLTVRKDGKPVDPFSGGMAACGAKTNSLWRPQDRAVLAWRDSQVLNMGFAAGPVSMDDVERGGLTGPKRSSMALTAYVRAISLRQGDIQSLVVTGPDGREMARSDLPALDHDKAQYQMFTGRKLTTTAWPAGAYTATYTVTRAGKTVVSKTIKTTL